MTDQTPPEEILPHVEAYLAARDRASDLGLEHYAASVLAETRYDALLDRVGKLIALREPFDSELGFDQRVDRAKIAVERDALTAAAARLDEVVDRLNDTIEAGS